MRILEQVQSLSCVIIFSLPYVYGDFDTISRANASIPYIVLFLAMIFGSMREGTRLIQFVYLLGYFIALIYFLICLIFDTDSLNSIVVDIIFALLWSFYFITCLFVGWGNFARFSKTGPY